MKRFGPHAIGTATFCAAVVAASPVSAQYTEDNYIGEISYWGTNFCPLYTIPADGRTLSIAQNTALFSLYGTTFGGNGQTTFAVPDLRGRRAIGAGPSAGNNTHSLGEMAGTEYVTMTVSQMPAHTHTAALRALDVAADTTSAVRAGFGKAAIAGRSSYSTAAPNTNLRLGDVQMDLAGGNQPFPVRNPALALTICIATQGIFPSRN